MQAPREKREREEEEEEEEEEESSVKRQRGGDHPPLLTEDQRRAIDMALAGESFFFTGCAGTGKSLLLREMVRALRDRHGGEHVHVTASTGIAACNVGGITLHSFAGVGLAEEDADTLVKRVWKRGDVRRRWAKARVLIVDEVSMVEAGFFEKLERIARSLRASALPFGGLQVILCGDFYQLPPVTRGGEAVSFCFESPAWARTVADRAVVLRRVFRQSDSRLVDLLGDVREGRLTPAGDDILRRSAVPFEGREGNDPEIAPTRLCPYRREVEEKNLGRLAELTGAAVEMTARDSGEQPFLTALQANCPALATVRLKVGAQVILLKNLSRDLVNGSRGVVVGFRASGVPPWDMTGDRFPDVRFADGSTRLMTPERWTVEVGSKVVAAREQVPLALAWALSIHKSQGMSIAKAEMSLGGAWECGQAYVALSRVTSLEGLRLLDYSARSFRAHPKVRAFYRALEEVSGEE